MSTAPRVAITPGCPCGVGPEVVARALANPTLRAKAAWLVAGAAGPIGDAFQRHAPGVQLEPGTACAARGSITVWDSAPARARFVPGLPTATADVAAAAALRRVLQAAQRGAVDAVATGPVRKQSLLRLAGGHFPGHTEAFHHALGTTPVPVMLFVAPGMRLALHTIHLPLARVPGQVTRQKILTTLAVLCAGLRGDLGVTGRVDVLGLNPHAGEGGLLGTQEQRVLGPALAAARAAGLAVAGPFPADGYFARYAAMQDPPAAVLALYHDQGLGPFKLWEAGRGCQMTLGLAVPRTSCDHGTAYDIAGHGKADDRSMGAAVRLAVAVARRRINAARV